MHGRAGCFAQKGLLSSQTHAFKHLEHLSLLEAAMTLSEKVEYNTFLETALFYDYRDLPTSLLLGRAGVEGRMFFSIMNETCFAF